MLLAVICQPEFTEKYVAMNNELLDKMESWGVNIPKKRISTGPMTYMIGVDLDLTLKMRATATKLGVKFIDKTTISDLLTRDGQIAGAVGYSIIDGTFYVLKENPSFSVPEVRTTVWLRCGVTDVVTVSQQLTVPAHRCEIRSLVTCTALPCTQQP